MDKRDAAIEIIAAVGLAIKKLGSIPSGHLYARLMGHMTLEQYENLKSQGFVKEENHLLTWIRK